MHQKRTKKKFQVKIFKKPPYISTFAKHRNERQRANRDAIEIRITTNTPTRKKLEHLAKCTLSVRQY